MVDFSRARLEREAREAARTSQLGKLRSLWQVMGGQSLSTSQVRKAASALKALPGWSDFVKNLPTAPSSPTSTLMPPLIQEQAQPLFGEASLAQVTQPRTQTAAPPRKPPTPPMALPAPMEFEPGPPEMIRVSSSNVYAIGYSAESHTLYVQYLADLGQGVRSGPGAMYEYFDVPEGLFDRFKMAASKGTFVWDELRMRGTISGHKYSYDLSGLSASNYVPRRAQLRHVGGGRAAEFFVPRIFHVGEVRKGRLQMRGIRSQLPEQQVGRSWPLRRPR